MAFQFVGARQSCTRRLYSLAVSLLLLAFLGAFLSGCSVYMRTAVTTTVIEKGACATTDRCEVELELLTGAQAGRYLFETRQEVYDYLQDDGTMYEVVISYGKDRANRLEGVNSVVTGEEQAERQPICTFDYYGSLICS